MPEGVLSTTESTDITLTMSIRVFVSSSTCKISSEKTLQESGVVLDIEKLAWPFVLEHPIAT
jgi:hypothetical protein